MKEEGEEKKEREVDHNFSFSLLPPSHDNFPLQLPQKKKKKKGRMCGDCFCLSHALNDPCKLSLYPVRSFNVYLFIFVFDNRENGEC